MLVSEHKQCILKLPHICRAVLALATCAFLLQTMFTDPGMLPKLEPSEEYMRMQLPRCGPHVPVPCFLSCSPMQACCVDTTQQAPAAVCYWSAHACTCRSDRASCQPTCLEKTVPAAMIEDAGIVSFFVSHLTGGAITENCVRVASACLCGQRRCGQIRRRFCLGARTRLVSRPWFAVVTCYRVLYPCAGTAT